MAKCIQLICGRRQRACRDQMTSAVDDYTTKEGCMRLFIMRAIGGVGVLYVLSTAAPAWSAMEGQIGDTVPPASTKEKSSMSKEYAIPPVVPKNLKRADSHAYQHKAVKNVRGEDLGTIESVFIDGRTQQPMY